MKVGPRLYLYTAIDDCTRYRILALYPRRAADNSFEFLEKVQDETPFPTHRIQTDRGLEFFAYAFQEKLMEYHIKFDLSAQDRHAYTVRERSMQTALDEFYATVDLSDLELPIKLEAWQDYYNCSRPEKVFYDYGESRENIRYQDYTRDTRFRKLKRSR